MPKASDFINSSTINADLVGDKPVKCRILSAEPQSTRDDKIKLGIEVDKFPDKNLLLNATNLKILINAYGENYEKWVGKTITLKTEDTLYMGTPTKGVRVHVGK